MLPDLSAAQNAEIIAAKIDRLQDKLRVEWQESWITGEKARATVDQYELIRIRRAVFRAADAIQWLTWDDCFCLYWINGAIRNISGAVRLLREYEHGSARALTARGEELMCLLEQLELQIEEGKDDAVDGVGPGAKAR